MRFNAPFIQFKHTTKWNWYLHTSAILNKRLSLTFHKSTDNESVNYISNSEWKTKKREKKTKKPSYMEHDKYSPDQIITFESSQRSCTLSTFYFVYHFLVVHILSKALRMRVRIESSAFCMYACGNTTRLLTLFFCFHALESIDCTQCSTVATAIAQQAIAVN